MFDNNSNVLASISNEPTTRCRVSISGNEFSAVNTVFRIHWLSIAPKRCVIEFENGYIIKRYNRIYIYIYLLYYCTMSSTVFREWRQKTEPLTMIFPNLKHVCLIIRMSRDKRIVEKTDQSNKFEMTTRSHQTTA